MARGGWGAPGKSGSLAPQRGSHPRWRCRWGAVPGRLQCSQPRQVVVPCAAAVLRCPEWSGPRTSKSFGSFFVGEKQESRTRVRCVPWIKLVPNGELLPTTVDQGAWTPLPKTPKPCDHWDLRLLHSQSRLSTATMWSNMSSALPTPAHSNWIGATGFSRSASAASRQVPAPTTRPATNGVRHAPPSGPTSMPRSPASIGALELGGGESRCVCFFSNAPKQPTVRFFFCKTLHLEPVTCCLCFF